jgi:BirA family biotin operon repressor/biotin-[acetyl-CoA-carboxylase] ligase
LPPSENQFDLPTLRERLKPFQLHWYPTVESTSDQAAQLRHRGELFAPAVVLAGEQTAGRGRGTNAWWSAAGSLTVTFVLPMDENIQPHHLPLIAGLAARNAAAELSGDNGIQLKWPNDLLYDGRKLAGLLCERILGADLIGIGLNVNLDPELAPLDLRARITSLARIRGNALDLTDALVVLSSHLRVSLARAAQEPFGVLLREYDAHHALIGREICVAVSTGEPPVCGICQGMDEIGRLLLRSGGQIHRIISGQVTMR